MHESGRSTMSTTSVRNTPTQQEARPAFRHLRRGHVITGVLLLVLLIVVALTAFGSPLWQVLGTGMFLLSLAVVVLLSLGVLLFTVLMAAIAPENASAFSPGHSGFYTCFLFSWCSWLQ